jgi:2-polyprenyl-6-methoxyphenol hydroxylase-like FAD-dependent oxidoreductase
MSPANPFPRALVLGGSLAGLLAARVLSDHYAEVLVVDRDDLDTPLDAPRRGVPQSKHTHGLLVRGAEAMESILPGLTDGVIARGGVRADIMGRSRWTLQDNQLMRVDSGLIGLLSSRVLLESEVRRQVAATPRVRFLGNHDIVGLLSSADRSRVTGARVAPRGTGASASFTDLEAALVVDATGRGSRAAVWLRELGYDEPEVTTVAAGVSYVTRLFRTRPGVLDDIDADVVGTRPPNGRSGVAARVEGDRWTVTLSGQSGEEPPGDLPDFLAYARTLPTQGIAEIIEKCEPIGGALPYRFPGSRWVRWERLERRPADFVVIGDAVCSFNPVYGQGMSSAAHQALRLRELLEQGGTARLADRAAKAFAGVAATPWALATGSDRRFPGMDRKPWPERVVDRYVDRLLEVASVDADVTLAFARVLNLLAPPPSLLVPRIAWRVLGPRSSARVRDARSRRSDRTTPAAQEVGATLSAVKG